MDNLLSSKTATDSYVNFAKKVFLALQHMIAMFGATVLVPLLTGFDVSTTLFCAGVGTLIFHLCTKKKVPVFLGSSFAFIPAIQTVYENYHSLSYAQGGIIVAGFFYVLLSLIINKIGVSKVTKYFPPQVVGPMIIVIGLNMVPTALNMASSNYLVAVITLLVAIITSRKGKGFIKQIAIIISVFVGYLISLKIGIVDLSPIQEASILSMPKFQAPKFDLGAIITIAPIILAVFMEHIGDITTNSAVVGEDFMKDPGLNRTLLGDGLATMFAGFVGGPANTTYGENTGILAITKNYDPSILRLAAVFAIVLSTVGKIGGFLQTIPQSVMGGISIMLFSMIALVGVKTLKNSHIDFNLKNIIIIAVIIIIGLGPNFGLNLEIQITDTIKLSGLALSAIVGVIINIILTKIENKLK
ncbi:uracil permease [Peptoniphilus stercorisuis]|uniref:Uracil permease n=1 Tax=Peptoniphilus stercorisuis TaxID=1436965 RepID=A0ABS4KC05_9FIRM|nr:uracil-xanthine permease family protein [Peptoniphilus stercorisuis]MBP2025308.1 uracil permease [Peptoniphilus stercorisuis]